MIAGLVILAAIQDPAALDALKSARAAYASEDYDAAAKFAAKVPPSDAAFEEACSLAGLANRALAEEKSRESADAKDPKTREKAAADAATFRRRAFDAFEKNAESVGASKERPAEMLQRGLTSLVHLTALAILPEIREPDRALKASDGWKRLYGDAAAESQIDLLRNRLVAHVQLVNGADRSHLAALDADLKDLERAAAKSPKAVDRIADAFTTVASAMLKAADVVAKADPETSKRLVDRADDLYVRALETRDIPEDVDARIPFMYAGIFYDLAKRRDDKARYKRAYELYEASRPRARLSPDQKRELDWRMAECLAAIGEWNRAIDAYKKLTGEGPATPAQWLTVALAYRDRAGDDLDAKLRKDDYRQATKIFARIAPNVRADGAMNDADFAIVYEYGVTLLLAGDYEKLHDLLDAELQHAEEWAKGPYASKFDALIDNYNKVAPRTIERPKRP